MMKVCLLLANSYTYKQSLAFNFPILQDSRIVLTALHDSLTTSYPELDNVPEGLNLVVCRENSKMVFLLNFTRSNI